MAEPDPNENEAGARDDDAAWAEIVAAYDEEPQGLVAGEEPWPAVENVEPDRDTAADPDRDTAGDHARDAADGSGEVAAGAGDGDGDEWNVRPGAGDGRDTDPGGAGRSEGPSGSFIVYAPGVGPRDWQPPELAGDPDEADEDHFVPPEPPPLPESDPTGRFAWLGFVGGPLLLIIAVVFQVDITWWIATCGVGGFLGGLLTLVLRMKDDGDDGGDDPGRGAVV